MDCFGQALLAYEYGMKDAHLQVESEGGISMLPVALFFRDSEYYELDRIALAHCKGKILDMGAGAGIHSLKLQQTGANVTAMDVSLGACEVMKKRGVKRVMHGDLFHLSTSCHFDTWILLGRSIGAVGSIDGFKQFLKMASKQLNPRGRIVFNSVDPGQMHRQRWMQFSFSDAQDKRTPWFDIHFRQVEVIAKQYGFEACCLHLEADGNYLAQLTKN
ncbi:hypothetical protein VST7929_02902 [Vibrio stylophorae]|uniref:Methyltransferase type 11 domain-containing protein n=1 Tax=Vibrio stylophorae TaxID=659351 RepID=A0ABM8ZX55_9VIBR|nr:methyltransferase domain-containing protein [Vibrio stylophorae]CAH0535274.1 hypothetical protein VST7929_02902 [Vibrio stylophorae]